MPIFGKKILDAMTPTGSKIPVGIHEGVEISSIEIAENYVDFNYMDSVGRKLNKRIYFPDLAKTTARDGKTVQETFIDIEESTIGDFFTHAKIFVADDVLSNMEFMSVKDAALKIKALLDPLLASAKVNLVVVPDKTGIFSDVARYRFIEKHVEGEKTKLYFSDYDKKRIAAASKGPDISSADTGDLI